MNPGVIYVLTIVPVAALSCWLGLLAGEAIGFSRAIAAARRAAEETAFALELQAELHRADRRFGEAEQASKQAELVAALAGAIENLGNPGDAGEEAN